MSFLDKIYEKYRKLFDRFNGTEFLEYSLGNDLKDNLNIYRGTHSYSWHLKAVFKKLKIKNDSILDIGCSKGAAMYLMSKFNFSTIDGIEISENFSRIARKNFIKLNLPKLNIYNADARNFENYERYNMYYLYNPFSKDVCETVIKKIISSNPMNYEKIIIYNNPKYSFILEKNCFYRKLDLPGRWNNRIYIYSNYEKSKRLNI